MANEEPTIGVKEGKKGHFKVIRNKFQARVTVKRALYFSTEYI